MNARFWISLYVACSLVSACDQQDKTDRANAPTTGDPAKHGGTSTTPGGNAGEIETVPDKPTTPADDQPATVPPN